MSVMHITKENFTKEVLESDKPVLVDFWASWCGPCRALSPIIEELAAEMPNARIAKVNVEEERELAMKYSVMSIPTILVFEGGKVAKRSVGALPKDQLKALLG